MSQDSSADGKYQAAVHMHIEQTGFPQFIALRPFIVEKVELLGFYFPPTEICKNVAPTVS